MSHTNAASTPHHRLIIGRLVADEAPLSLVQQVHGRSWFCPESARPTVLGPGDAVVVRAPVTYTLSTDVDAPPSIVIGPGQGCSGSDGRDLSEEMAAGVRTWGNDPDGEDCLLVGTYRSDGEVGRLPAAGPSGIPGRPLPGPGCRLAAPGRAGHGGPRPGQHARPPPRPAAHRDPAGLGDRPGDPSRLRPAGRGAGPGRAGLGAPPAGEAGGALDGRAARAHGGRDRAPGGLRQPVQLQRGLQAGVWRQPPGVPDRRGPAGPTSRTTRGGPQRRGLGGQPVGRVEVG